VGMETLFSIAALVLVGIIAKFIVPYVLTFLSLPGRLMVSQDALGKCGQSRFILGALVTTLLQAYVYLAYTTFVVSGAVSAMRRHEVSFVVLFAAFFAVIIPLGAAHRDVKARLEAAKRLRTRDLNESVQNKANEHERKLDVTVRASSVTFVLAVIAFFVFAFIPRVMVMTYPWAIFIS